MIKGGGTSIGESKGRKPMKKGKQEKEAKGRRGEGLSQTRPRPRGLMGIAGSTHIRESEITISIDKPCFQTQCQLIIQSLTTVNTAKSKTILMNWQNSILSLCCK